MRGTGNELVTSSATPGLISQHCECCRAQLLVAAQMGKKSIAMCWRSHTSPCIQWILLESWDNSSSDDSGEKKWKYADPNDDKTFLKISSNFVSRIKRNHACACGPMLKNERLSFTAAIRTHHAFIGRFRFVWSQIIIGHLKEKMKINTET